MEKITFSKGDVICYQGDETDGLFILVDGELEVLVAEKITAGMKKNDIIAVSKKIGVINEKKTPFGEISFILNAPRNATVRAISSSGVVVKIPTGKEALNALLETNPVIGLSICKTLLHKSLSTYGVIENTIKLMESAQMYYDNFAYVYYKVNMNAKDKTNTVYTDGKKLYEKAHGAENKLAEKLSLAIIDTNLSQVFERDYGLDIEIPDINLEIIELIKSILYLPEKVARIVIKLNPNVVELFCYKLGDYLQKLNSFFISVNKLSEESILRLAGKDQSVFEAYFALYALLKSANHPSLGFFEKASGKLMKIIKEIHSQYSEMFGTSIKDLHPEYKKQEIKIIQTDKHQEEQKIEQKKKMIVQQSDLIFDDNFNKLQSIPVSSNETKQKLRGALEKYSKIVDKFDTVGDTRKIKKDLDSSFWEYYRDMFKYYMDNQDTAPNYILLMLRYGVLDENTLNEDTVNCLKTTPLESKNELPIYYADEWLERIYNNEEKPSMNGLGQTYEEFMKDNKTRFKDPAQQLLDFEAREVIAAAVRTCAGLIAQQTPILDSDYISLKPENCIVTKDRLEKTVKEILEIDFACFYREIRIVYGENQDFIQKEIAPNFIIVPVAGSKAVCWQELDGKNKASRGRIMVPLFATADLKEMLMSALANFKWELSKTIVGPNWGDPVEGGLTGKYFDYTSVYKQSKELSAEVKEKIKKQFKKFPQTKDRFTDDYLDWINYESNSTFKLNPLNRAIFFDYVPFHKRIRDKVSTNPNFQKLNFKFVNLNTKKLQSIENKIKKLEKTGVEIPVEVTKEMEYWKQMI